MSDPKCLPFDDLVSAAFFAYLHRGSDGPVATPRPRPPKCPIGKRPVAKGG